MGALLIALLGATPALASDTDTVREIRCKRTTTADGAGSFQIWFSGFSRFFRLANRLMNPLVPPVSAPILPPEDEQEQPVLYFSPPQDSIEDQQVLDFIDGSDPIG